MVAESTGVDPSQQRQQQEKQNLYSLRRRKVVEMLLLKQLQQKQQQECQQQQQRNQQVQDDAFIIDDEQPKPPSHDSNDVVVVFENNSRGYDERKRHRQSSLSIFQDPSLVALDFGGDEMTSCINSDTGKNSSKEWIRKAVNSGHREDNINVDLETGTITDNSTISNDSSNDFGGDDDQHQQQLGRKSDPDMVIIPLDDPDDDADQEDCNSIVEKTATTGDCSYHSKNEILCAICLEKIEEEQKQLIKMERAKTGNQQTERTIETPPSYQQQLLVVVTVFTNSIMIVLWNGLLWHPDP